MLQIGFDEKDPIPDKAVLDFSVYRKKPVSVMATPMMEDFEVKTPEGVMQGRKGDYLVMGLEGELYPVKPSVFARSYELAEGKSNALDSPMADGKPSCSGTCCGGRS